MHIVVDARYINDHFPGIGRYVYNLLLALAQIETPHRITALYNPALANTRYDIATLERQQLRLLATPLRPFSLAEQLALPRLLRGLGADCFHAPYYVMPYANLPCPAVVTLYDTIPRRFPAEVSPRARLLFDLLTRLAVRSATHVLAISASARDDLQAAYRIGSSHISVTPLAADPRFGPQPAQRIGAMREKYDLRGPYILSLASNKPHKNLAGLVEAFARLVQSPAPQPRAADSPPQLVIAGHWDPRYPQARALAEQLGLGAHLRFLANVAEGDLPALYSGAELFAFPSRYEGFGLPPLEAMACGVPVLCSDSSSLPEVVGDAALRVAPTVDGLAAGLAQLLNDARLRAELRRAALHRAAQFSWQRTATATLAVYEQIGRNSTYAGHP